MFGTVTMRVPFCGKVARSRSAPGEVYRVSSLHFVAARSQSDLPRVRVTVGITAAVGVELGAGVDVRVEGVAVAVALAVAVAVGFGVAVGRLKA